MTFKGGFPKSLVDRKQVLRVAWFDAGGLGNMYLNPWLLFKLLVVQDVQEDNFVVN